MKKNKICLLLSILVVSCLVLLPGKQAFAAGAEGGQVSVPGKITFESAEKEEVTQETKEKEKPKGKINKPAEDNSGKKFYSILPKTGESNSNPGVVGIGFLMIATGFFLKRKVGDQK
ncbi:LPXTG cell wall anchor domain-containing protein [Vagococcus carniphilus]|uniref:LPXTG cell wall anchor domain-containing protein n=1 Tax=Vagococcus carniphilus TaxID=218144 RepID=UPI00288E1031|nr:LPXTG cell wall anchor domain-containing protein [Vagococcus carniphilus]MDT2848866.1 LPXTG cell wall anchor domain-containing protein [Vagococcus carniphilus]